MLADALTSVLAIIALVSGKYYGWNWLDPVMGIVGAAVISRWSYDEEYKSLIRERIEGDADNRITDLHVWKVGPAHYAAILSLVTHRPRPPVHYKRLLAGLDRLSHVTVEANRCAGESCVPSDEPVA